MQIQFNYTVFFCTSDPKFLIRGNFSLPHISSPASLYANHHLKHFLVLIPLHPFCCFCTFRSYCNHQCETLAHRQSYFLFFSSQICIRKLVFGTGGFFQRRKGTTRSINIGMHQLIRLVAYSLCLNCTVIVVNGAIFGMVFLFALSFW